MVSAAITGFVGAIILARVSGQSSDFAVFAEGTLQAVTAKPA